MSIGGACLESLLNPACPLERELGPKEGSVAEDECGGGRVEGGSDRWLGGGRSSPSRRE